MGRIKCILKGMRYQLINLIPYKYRRPFILYFSILGLVGYYNFAMYISFCFTGGKNTYLAIIGDTVSYVMDMFINFKNKGLLILVIIAVFAWITYKYCIRDEKSDRNNQQENQSKETYHNHSWYYQINSMISFVYALITILTIIFIVGGLHG